jgi:hypothetical protein
MNKNRVALGLLQDHIIVTALFLQNRRSSVAKTSSNIGKDKSFVYDLNKERGTVSVRVASVPRSAEVKPFVLEICIIHFPPSFWSRWGGQGEWGGRLLA